MWLSLLEGFFSVVEAHDDATKVVVRARRRADLVELRRTLVPALGQIYSTPHRDYPHRCVISKEAFGTGLARVVTEGLRYTNHKAAVSARDPMRGRVLARAWAVFRELEGDDERGEVLRSQRR